MLKVVLLKDLVLFAAFIQDNDVRSYIVDSIPITMAKVMIFYLNNFLRSLFKTLPTFVETVT